MELAFEVEVIKDLKLFAAVNNIFDVNNHPIFIAQDATPCTANRVNQNAPAATPCRDGKSSPASSSGFDQTAVLLGALRSPRRCRPSPSRCATPSIAA